MGGLPCRNRKASTATTPNKALLISHLERHSTEARHDKYGRTLADVFLLDETHVNHTLVKEGWCWWYRKYAPRDRVLEGLERNARIARKGLWVAPNQVPPWEWRKSRVHAH